MLELSRNYIFKVKSGIVASLFFLCTPLFFVFSVFLRFKSGYISQKDDFKNVLIIYTESLGDFIMFTSALRVYKKEFEKSNKRLFLMINEQNKIKGFFSEETIFYFNEAIWKNPIKIFKFIKNNYRKFDVIVNANTNQYASRAVHFFVLFLGAQKTIKLSGENFLDYFKNQRSFIENAFIGFVNRMYTDIVHSSSSAIQKDKITHVISYHKDLLEYVFETTFFQIIPSFDDYVPSISKPFLDKFDKLLDNERFVIFVCGAGQQYREWPFDRFLILADYLKQRGVKSVFVGTKKESAFFSPLLPKEDFFINLIGQLSLNELLFLISQSLLVIGNETGPIHAAIALRKPSICILGGGHFGRCSLYGYEDINIWVYKKTSCYLDNWMCGIENNLAPCINIINVELVKEKLDNLLRYVLLNKNIPRAAFKIYYESSN